MWRNADVLDFVGWLREHNDSQPAAERVGFYGLDLYSLHASMDAVLGSSDSSTQCRRARQARYACLMVSRRSAELWLRGLTRIERDLRAPEVVSQLVELRRAVAAYANRDGRLAADDLFFAQQNAQVVRDAGAVLSRHVWEPRGFVELARPAHEREPPVTAGVSGPGTRGRQDRRMGARSARLGATLARRRMGAHGELNVGQLVRQRYGGHAVAVGFTTYGGTVTAASDWGGDQSGKWFAQPWSTVRGVVPRHGNGQCLDRSA